MTDGQTSWAWPSTVTLALTSSSFLVGIMLGRRLTSTYRRVTSLVAAGPTKMALVVREDLKMGKGKIAGQCSHGTLLAYQNLQKINPQLLQAWEDSGQLKVVLKANDLQHINRLTEEAVSRGVPVATVSDAGRTQVARGSLTVLAVGPARTPDIDTITGTLRLL